MEILKIFLGVLATGLLLYGTAWAVAYFQRLPYSGWKPEGDSEGVNWRRCKMERWENERRALERRVNNLPVDNDRRNGIDRRENQGGK